MKKIVRHKDRKIEVDASTEKKIVDALLSVRNGQRIRLFYGDTKTGRSWNEECDIKGTVSTSTGDTACLILVNNATSTGGGAILDSCIVRIDVIETRESIYKHPGFYVDLFNIENKVVNENKEVQARFNTPKQALNYVKFMNGERYSK